MGSAFFQNFSVFYQQEKWDLLMGINNLFDKEYMGNVRLNASFGRYYEAAPTRNVYAGVMLRYGF